MKKKFEEILKNFKNKRILIIGDIILDRTEWGKISSRENPENSKVKIVNIGEEKFYLGGAANVAKNIASLGGKSFLCGVIGKDIYGHRIKELAKEGKVNTDNLIYIDQPTIVKARIFIEGEYRHRADLGERDLKKINIDVQKEIFMRIKRDIKEYHGIIFSDYNKHLFSGDFSKEIIKIARKENIPVFTDMKPKNLSLFKGSYIISPNKKEAEEITGIKYKNNKETLYKIGKKLSDKINSKKAIITCGSEGAYLYDDENSEMVPAKGEKIVEFTGAGDTFISTLTLGVVSGLNIRDAIELANYAAGIVVGKEGTATTSVEEILKTISESA